MKRIAGLLLIICMIFGIPVCAQGSLEEIKVGLKFAYSAVDEAVLSCEKGFVITGGDKKIEIEDNAVTIAKRPDGGFLALGFAEFPDVPELTVSPKEEGTLIGAFGKTYRGRMLFTRLEGSDMNVINVLPLEQYLYSVVGIEMSPSWNIEALKAQAVCARTFAVMNQNKYQKYGFNVDDSTNSQAYRGTASEAESTRKAVDETKGQVVTYNGKVAEVFYSSSSGGHTENSENVWVSKLPYLTGVPDPYEDTENIPNGIWKVELTKEEIKEILAKKNIDIGDIVDVVAVETTESGRVKVLKIVGTTGEKTWEKDNVRAALDSGMLKSAMFTIEKPGAKTISFTQPGKKKAKGDPSIAHSDILAQRYGISTTVNSRGGDTYVFSGRGWGHGVGMSQWGAKGMADAGKTYIEILEHYFTGIEVK